jgi:predicted DCC family thiol-disulfide oxidoreductase YuxK
MRSLQSLRRFVLARDRRRQFRFASLQGAFGARALARHGMQLDGDPTSIVLLESPESPHERAYVRSDAVLGIMSGLGGPWRLAAAGLRVIPRFLRDDVYDLVARVRYRIFGRLESCPLPPRSDASRFLD